jgi:hypothetical protein
MGGESTQSLALAVMRAAATNYIISCSLLQEKDPGILKMGGESTQSLALAVMRFAAKNYIISCSLL